MTTYLRNTLRWFTCLLCAGAISLNALAEDTPKLPRIVGDWWQVAGSPDLGDLTTKKQLSVDFAIWRAADGTWQIWECISHTLEPGFTRLLYRWEGKNLADTNWTPMGIAMHADTNVGEGLGCLQAPFVFRDNTGRFAMFYGACKGICSADSPPKDGKTFTRILNAQRQSVRFADGGGARDPMLLRVGNLWHCYYCARPKGVKGAGVYCRTSPDLKTWSESRIVSSGGQAGTGPSSTECPFVVELEPGRFYLFHTQHYGGAAQTSVYFSRDPLNFGVDHDEGHFLCHLPVAAPEIIRHEGQYYIAALRPSLKGIQIARLEWATANTQIPRSALRTEEIRALVTPLDSSMDRIQHLIAKAAAAGAETRYFRVSLTVLKRYRKEVFDMGLAKAPYVKEQTARFLVECAGRTELGLEEAIRHPEKTIKVPNVDLLKLDVREGSFFSRDRPVMLAGLCGWASPKDFDYLSSIGCTVFAGEKGPNSVFPEEHGRNDINALTAILDAAEKYNMKLDLLLSSHYIPKWAYDKWPDLDPENRRKSNQFMPWDARSPHLKEILSSFLDVLIPQVRIKPALLDYDLINEAWYHPFKNLDEAIVTDFMKSHPSVKREDVPEQYTTEKVADFIKWYKGEVQKRDGRHPIYVKVLTSQEILCVDREALGEILTANGMDCYPEYPDRTGVLAADLAWTLLRIDFHRSLTPDKPILDGEYHPCAGAYEMPDSYFRTAMWAPALHGQDSAALWVYGRVDDVSIDWHANGVEVLGHSALDFLRLGEEIHAFQRQRGLIAVYYGGYHENSRPGGDGGKGIREAYLASLFQDSDIGILTEKRVQSGALSQYRLVVLPDGSKLSPDVRRRIEDFRKTGGVVVQCPPRITAKILWPTIHSAVVSVGIEKFVSTDQWGVECRSAKLGSRRIFYLINHNNEPVDVLLKSSWPVNDMLELRTHRRLQGARVHLESLEFRLIEVISE